MKVTSSAIVDGMIDPQYGKYGSQKSAVHGRCTRSFPLKIENAPQGTVSFAIIMEDKDAVPINGYSWIHWTAANLTRTDLAANESLTATDFVQGTNSLSGKIVGVDRMDAIGYQGPGAPECPHTYETHVYALDTMLDLEPGFYMNELYWKMKGHILDQYTMEGIYHN
jgi:Raf kinase inhibitor-like YbhB/YbcL family protein